MKKINLIIPLLSLLLSGCALLFNSEKTFEDEFKNTKTYSITQYLRPEEYRSDISSATITYNRIIKDSIENLKIYFVISRSTKSFQVDNKGFVKLDGKKFEINCITEASELKSKQESSTSSTTTKDSTSVKTTYNTDTKTVSWFDDKFVVELTPEMVNSLLKTDEILFRFYFGPEQVTFRVYDFYLKQIKTLFKKES